MIFIKGAYAKTFHAYFILIKFLHKNNMNYLIEVMKLFKNIIFKVEWFKLDSILELVRTFIP